jgi:hypothetical protein
LKIICKKRRRHLALYSYCADLLNFLKQNQNKKHFKKRFASKLRRQALDTQARQGGYNNGIRLAIIGGREYSSTLDRYFHVTKNNVVKQDMTLKAKPKLLLNSFFHYLNN